MERKIVNVEKYTCISLSSKHVCTYKQNQERKLVEFNINFLIWNDDMTFVWIGGIDVTLTGYGFSEDDNVTIAGSPCKTKSTTPTQIVCTAPNSVS